MVRYLWIGIGLATLAGSCATKADTPEPPAAFAAAAQAVASPAEAARAPEEAWIDTFAMPELTGYVTEALKGNPGLQAAGERAQAAKERARASAGSWLPDLNISLGTSRTETPVAGSDNRLRFDESTSRLSTTWEADLWGRVLDGTRASFADSRAANADYDGARLSVAGQTASAWIDLVESRQLLALAEEDLSQRERALDITQRRYAGGLLTALSLRTARSQVASARAQRAAQQDALLQASRRLQFLLGRYPDAALQTQSEMPALQPIAAAGAPADLLARRPDVAAAEARLESSGLRASQARKALLPRLTLSATASGSGDGLRDITDIDGLITQVLGGLTAPLFNGGALRAEARAAQADARASASNYVTTALTAWGEVEGALSADTAFAIRETELASAAVEAREAQLLAEREYASGVATIFELIDAYTRRIDAERGLIQARAARASNRVTYHVALGGGAETGGLAAPTTSRENNR
ncbi:MAG: efflux transporter outer membrane subunit [Alphaproteobacteria bacterium]|nr:efflux transporter outer membrane subunit [Alphaproteobacteria bacterium]